MTKVQPGIHVMPLDGLPDISQLSASSVVDAESQATPVIEIPVLIIGGGPAGLSAANELGQLGIKTLLIDDKSQLGGKLVLQTHRFFGSTEAVLPEHN